MKRSLRFFFALFFAKGTALVLKLIGRKGTSMPGSWAIILCPDFLGRMPRPKTVIGITGTNGKTTVANMVEDILEDNGYDFVCNRMGTNVNTGVASSLIANSTFLGKPKKELAIFELDERSSPKILPYIKPDILLCTNIFRDSYKRNAHMEFILDILTSNIPPETRLVLNGDDLLCSSIAPSNSRVCFGIESTAADKKSCDNIVCDIRSCPKCGTSLVWDIVRYHHIGRAHCPKCGFESPERKYLAREIKAEKDEFTVEIAGKPYKFPLPNSSTINVYNALSAIALLSEFGLGANLLSASMEKLTISESRYQETSVAGKKLILHLAKGQNPVACSRAFENVRDYPGKKAVILFLDDYFDATHTVENISWFYDTDFEFLNNSDIPYIIAAGARCLDIRTRLLIAGVPVEKIICTMKNEDAPSVLPDGSFDSVFILYDVYTIKLANSVKDMLKERLERESRGTGAEDAAS